MTEKEAEVEDEEEVIEEEAETEVVEVEDEYVSQWYFQVKWETSDSSFWT